MVMLRMEGATRMNNIKKVRMFIMVASLLAVALGATAADKPSDTVVSLGVGARAVGMGGAFTSVVMDATSSFWNPAGLAWIGQQDMTIMGKTLPKTDTLLGGRNEFNPLMLTSDSDTPTGNPGLVYAGYAAPISVFTRNPGTRGTVSISWTRGGYFEQDIIADQLLDLSETTRETSLRHRKIVTDYYTLAYGMPLTDNVKVGAGVIYASQNYKFNYSGFIEVDTGDEWIPLPISSPSVDETGSGWGGIVGIQGAASLGKQEGKPFKWGVAYRTPINLSSDNTFSDELPGRLTGGIAYEFPKTPTTISFDVHMYFKANEGLEDERDEVTNYALGLEHVFIPGNGNVQVPVRLGVSTSNSANPDMYDDETMLHLGAGWLTPSVDYEFAATANSNFNNAQFLVSVSFKR